jgi:hypothetical protein
MSMCFNEPTIDELLDDHLTQGLMRADGVDAAALRGMLYALAGSYTSPHRPIVDRASPVDLDVFHHSTQRSIRINPTGTRAEPS